MMVMMCKQSNIWFTFEWITLASQITADQEWKQGDQLGGY